jgi:hypothetical protein
VSVVIGEFVRQGIVFQEGRRLVIATSRLRQLVGAKSNAMN